MFVHFKGCFRAAIWSTAVAITLSVASFPTTASASVCTDEATSIPWNYSGNTNWNIANANRLCQGNHNSRAPARCFYRVMFGNVNWGGGTRWQWKNAIDLCEGARNERSRITCFQRYIRIGYKWKAAIQLCDERAPGACVSATLNTSWDYSGSLKPWNLANARRLCRRWSAANTQPQRCFQQVMFGNVSWGGGTRWNWRNAIDLCEGSRNASATINCFKSKIASGTPWKPAIKACDTY